VFLEPLLEEPLVLCDEDERGVDQRNASSRIERRLTKVLSPNNRLHPQPKMHRKACDEGVQEVEMMTDTVNISQEWQDKSDETQFKEEGVEKGVEESGEGVEEGGDVGEHVVVVVEGVLFSCSSWCKFKMKTIDEEEESRVEFV
jgi:hypothetical protein